MRRRDFGLFSLIGALGGLGGGEEEKDGWMGLSSEEMGLMDIEEMKERFGDVRLRYGVLGV